MRGICRWLATATCTLAAVSASAQTPVGKPSTSIGSTPIESGLPGGTVVGGAKAPAGNVSILQAVADPPVPMPPVEKAPEPTLATPKPVTTIAEEAKAPIVPSPTPPVAPQNYDANCCGPIGSHGPIGQEVYMRIGHSEPQGTGRLAFNLDPGTAGQIGLRSQFFNQSGYAAWVVDTHVMYTYNPGEPKDIHTFRTEPVVVRSLHRTAVGLGLGRDWFLAGPGFILDTWDLNFRFGMDGGGRWGTGHLDMRNPFEVDSYRRHQDTFTQTFGGVMGTFEVPVAGWTFLLGGRGECAYTWSHFLPTNSNFREITWYVTFGVRY